MGYYHLSANIISRGKGQSAVASASYRSGEKLWCEDDQEYKDYRTREVQPETMILAPENAPDFVYDREKLWNEVERVESNVNSQLSREIRVALPSELSNEKQMELVKEFSEDNFVERGMVADISIHRDKQHNPHAHIMLTIRPFNEDGSWGKKTKKEYILDENGNKTKTPNGNVRSKNIFLTDWGKKETLENWRENWAVKVNEYYKESGLNITVSHESYEKQGIDKYATHRLTYDEYNAEKEAQIQAQMKGEEYEPVTHMGMVNQDIKDTNELKDLLQHEIVSLEEYKETLEREIDEQYIPHVRNNFPLSNQQAQSLQFVAKRVHGYVTYENAKENMENMKNWGKSIEFSKRKLGVESIMLDNAEKEYNVDQTRSVRFGLSPQKFAEEKGEKISSLNNRAFKYECNFNAYEKAEIHSNLAFEVQKKIVHQEFGTIYPEYSHITENHNTLISDLKYDYVQEYLKTGIKHENIKEFEDPQILKYYTSERENDVTLKKDWEENQHRLLIANRSVSKWSKEYSRIYSEGGTKDKIYDTRLKLEIAKYQVKQRENEKVGINDKMNKTLSFKYQNQPSKLIEQIPTKLKARLLELHLDDRATGKLSKDLKTVEKDLAKEGKDISHLYDKEFTQAGASIGGIAKLFANLGGQAQGNDKKQDIDEMKRKSRSKMKEKTLYKEHEIEL